MKTYTVMIGSNKNSVTTKDQLISLGAARGVSVEFFPSRKFEGCEVMKLNGQAVAYNFQNQEDAILYAGGGI